MKFFANLESVSKKTIKAELETDLDLSIFNKLLSNNKNKTIEIEVSDGRKITPDQRKKAYALIGDIARWSGFDFIDEAPQYMKLQFYLETGSDSFSLSNCSVSKANEYITFLIDFCFENDIAFASRTWEMIPNDYAMQLRCIRHRKCCICGKKAEIDHFYPVGMGRSKRNLDHTKFYYMALCNEHHINDKHQVGRDTFFQKYHIKPIKLDEQDIKKLHIGG